MDLIVETKYGKVEGFTEKKINKWFGIPYAKPPIGSLRYRRAVPCDPWEGIKSCKKFGNKSIQFMKPIYKSSTVESEDCLYLNIWRKKTETGSEQDKKLLPVFIWIHGGYLHFGEGSERNLDGTHFATQDIIYITFNYRLGPLGCYDFSCYDKDRFDSNCSLSDQIQLLRWVKENIEAFGGDPSNITIAGESSGGASVCALLASPHTEGLFQKVICQSGLPKGFHTKRSMKYPINLFLSYLNISPDNIKEIETIDIDKLKEATQYVNENIHLKYPGALLPGIMYDDLFPDDCFTSVKNGNTKGIKLIIGTCKDEGSFFYQRHSYPYTWQDVKDLCERNHNTKDISEVEKVYNYTEDEKQKIIDINTDLLFLSGSIKLADYQSKDNDVWMYQFNYAPVFLRLLKLNATHGIDVSICTKNATKDFVWFLTPYFIKRRIMNEMFGSWVNFAKNGDPNGDHLNIKWEKYNDNQHKTLYFDKKTHLVENPSRDRYELWKDMINYYK